MKKLLTAVLIYMSFSGLALAENMAAKVAETANATWNKTFNSADSAALANLYAEDATLSPGNGAVLNGRKEIAGLFQSFFDNGVHNHQIKVINTYAQGDQVVQLSHWQADGADAEGNKVTFGGILISVLEKNNEGKWVVRSHVWNMAS